MLGLDVSHDCQSIAAARIEDAVSPAIYYEETLRLASERQIEFGKSLDLDLTNESLRVASAKIQEELFRRNAVAAESLGLKAGDRVIKRESFLIQGKEHVLEQEYIISSIDTNSLRVWFRGGNGRGAWPTQLEKVSGDSTISQVPSNSTG